MDSGGFTQISRYGAWDISPQNYALFARRCMTEIGNLDFVAPMDWMCESFVLAKTGKSLREHQRLTVENYIDLVSIDPGVPWIPVVQGYSVDDYLRCVDLYQKHGVDLRQNALVGVGSVCRRQAENEAVLIFHTLHAIGLKLHGFGVKIRGMARYRSVLTSSDSMAWSYSARRNEMIEGCTHSYENCANCPLYALRWHERFIADKDVVLPRRKEIGMKKIRSISKIETALMTGRTPSWDEMKVYAAWMGLLPRIKPGEVIIDGPAQFGEAWDKISAAQRAELIVIADQNARAPKAQDMDDAEQRVRAAFGAT